MNSLPEIAIIDSNTLCCLGLENLIQELIPQAVIRTFSSFADLTDDTPDAYAHYFVSSGIYFEHTAFFLERRKKTIVLTERDHMPQLASINTLDISQEETQLAKSILRLHQHGHPAGKLSGKEESDCTLSPREIEVLILLVKGLIHKEIAERLNISLTTVISHRKNITGKLGIKSLSGLTIYAVMQGYIEADSI